MSFKKLRKKWFKKRVGKYVISHKGTYGSGSSISYNRYTGKTNYTYSSSWRHDIMEVIWGKSNVQERFWHAWKKRLDFEELSVSWTKVDTRLID